MSDALRALASVATVHEETQARAHAEALAAQERARVALDDANERCREAEAVLGDAMREPLATAGDRVLNEARCARLRERVRAARALRGAATISLDRAREAAERSQASLGAAHGERRVVAVAMERAAARARVVRTRKEDDEVDDFRPRTSRD